MRRCTDCRFYPWSLRFDPFGFSPVKCHEKLRAKTWTKGTRDEVNFCSLFQDKTGPVVPEIKPVIAKAVEAEPIEEVKEPPKKRGGRRASVKRNK